MTPTSQRLLDVLRVAPHGVIAAVGAGGKTTLLYRLAAEARESGLRVIVTTTTHMGTLPRAVTGPVLVDDDHGLDEAVVAHELAREHRLTVLGRSIRADKLEGLPPERIARLARLADVVLVEADGARQRSLKLPAAHEPVVPGGTDVVVVLAALDVLGVPLGDEHVHRLDLVRAELGLADGAVVEARHVAAVLLAPAGYRTRLPPGARAVVFLNKAEDDLRRRGAEAIATRLGGAFSAVVAGSARGGELYVWP